MYFLVLITLFLRAGFTYCNNFSITTYGLAEVQPGENALRFFIEILTEGPVSEHIILTEPHCCEVITHEAVDCYNIHVQAGDMGAPLVGTPFNITALFLNAYIYNRRGACVFNIYTPNRYKEQVEIMFDTSLRNSNQLLVGFEHAAACDTVDLDPFFGCQPVRCDLKYSGARSYFNATSKVCEPTPICYVAWDPVTNECIDPEITHNDIAALIEGHISIDDNDSEKVLCVNGYIVGGFCTCYAGWGTHKVDIDSAEGFRTCSISCNHDTFLSKEYFEDIAMYWSLRFFIAFLLFIPILILIITSERCRKTRDAQYY